MVALAVLAMILFRRAGQSGMRSVYWGGGVVLVGAMCAYALVDRIIVREQATDRRAIEARAADLTARSIAPGSALACLDAVASVVVESACEKSLFATPEAVASALAYVDARVSLLAPSVSLADRDPAYRPSLERARRALEADRFGLVAHVLTTRGCNGAECAELRLLRDPSRIAANMKARAFEAALGVHALAWQPNGSGVAAVASAPSSSKVPPLATTGTGSAAAAGGSPGATVSSRLDYSSASSIPAVSIMIAEPGTPPPPPPKRPAAAPAAPPAPARRQTARDAPAPPYPPSMPAPVAAAPTLAPMPPPPTQLVPQAAPAVPPAAPDQHSSQ